MHSHTLDVAPPPPPSHRGMPGQGLRGCRTRGSTRFERATETGALGKHLSVGLDRWRRPPSPPPHSHSPTPAASRALPTTKLWRMVFEHVLERGSRLYLFSTCRATRLAAKAPTLPNLVRRPSTRACARRPAGRGSRRRRRCAIRHRSALPSGLCDCHAAVGLSGAGARTSPPKKVLRRKSWHLRGCRPSLP